MEILKIIVSADFLYAVIRLTTPVLLATLASTIAERAGVTNMALEGTMLFAALFGVIGSAYTQSAFLGLLFAVLIAVLISLILAYFSLELKADITLAAIAINLLASGGTIFILYMLSGDRGMSSALQSKVIPQINIPLIENIPMLGKVVSGHNALTYLAFVMVAVVQVFLFRSSLGLRLRSVGENSKAAQSVGISVKKVQYIALILCGVLCGFAGAYMSMGYMSMFNRDMVAGRGYIALAASSVGRQTPLGGLLAALLFGFFDALSNNLQKFTIPAEFVQSIPYLATVVLLALSALRKRNITKRNRPEIL